MLRQKRRRLLVYMSRLWHFHLANGTVLTSFLASGNSCGYAETETIGTSFTLAAHYQLICVAAT